MSYLPEFQLEIVAEVSSTNAALLALSSGIHGIALLAKKQTAGHGRRGRSWDFVEGNLALSFALELSGEAQSIVPRLSFLTGVALFDTVRSFAPELDALILKWPNDLMLRGKKLAGLLVEARQSGAALRVVLGVGLNLRGAPNLPDAISLYEATGLEVPPEEFAQAFFLHLSSHASLLDDYTKLRAAWERRSLKAGETVFYGDRDHPASMRRATLLGLLGSGALLVRDEARGEEVALLSEDTSLRF